MRFRRFVEARSAWDDQREHPTLIVTPNEMRRSDYRPDRTGSLPIELLNFCRDHQITISDMVHPNYCFIGTKRSLTALVNLVWGNWDPQRLVLRITDPPKVAESLDSKVPYEVVKQSATRFYAVAEVAERRISVELDRNYDEDEHGKVRDNCWDLIFLEGGGPGGRVPTARATGSGGELKVFAVVKDIFVHFIELYRPTEVFFTADDELKKNYRYSNRARLYERFLRRLRLPGYKVTTRVNGSSRSSVIFTDFSLRRVDESAWEEQRDDEAWIKLYTLRTPWLFEKNGDLRDDIAEYCADNDILVKKVKIITNSWSHTFYASSVNKLKVLIKVWDITGYDAINKTKL